MSDIQLDPRAMKVQTVAKYTGVALVAVAASGAIIVAGASVVTASVVGIAALFMVNFAVPIAARSIAVWKQKGLTTIAEVFSEETIREDERLEGERIRVQESEYKTARAEIEGAQEALRAELEDARPEEKEILSGQITALQEVIDGAYIRLMSKKEDFVELKRLNKMYIALHRAGTAMTNSQGAERDSQQIQNLETSRNAIKARMRSAMAGQTIANMNAQLKPKSNDALTLIPKGNKQ